jgi:hypothetical protein
MKYTTSSPAMLKRLPVARTRPTFSSLIMSAGNTQSPAGKH